MQDMTLPATPPGPEAPNEVSAPSPLRRVLTWTAVALAAFSILSMVAGVVRSWDPLPYWDMWNGDVGFWYRLKGGDSSAWWAQHNEHRIVLARAAFWLDFRFFRGAGWPLIACNLLAVAGIVSLILRSLAIRTREDRGSGDATRNENILLGSAIVSIVTAWMQHENLLWGFQVQFFLATLLPLAALIQLALSSRLRLRDARAGRVTFFMGLILSVASTGTIASGVFVPFVATALLIALRARRTVVLIVAGIAVILTALYLTGYHSPPQHSQPVESLLSHPLTVVQYTLIYLGGPFWVVTGLTVVAMVGGLVYVGLLIGLGRSALTSRDHIGLAMAAFASYAAISGAATATGRLRFGVDQALSGRYMTPVLAAWACLIVLAAPRLQKRLRDDSHLTAIAVAAIPVLLLPQQLAALADPSEIIAARRLATLAIALDVPDERALTAVYPEPELPLRLGRRALADGLTVLGRAPYRELSSSLGSDIGTHRTVDCQGAVDTESRVRGSEFIRLSGWLSSTALQDGGQKRLLGLQGDRNRLIGFITLNGAPTTGSDGGSGERRPIRFAGYALAHDPVVSLSVVTQDRICAQPLR